jgi:hypothetical protein
MNKRKVPDNASLDTPRPKRLLVKAPLAAQKSIATGKAPRKAFVDKFPHLTRDPFFVGTYSLVLPLFGSNGDLAVIVIECLYNGIFAVGASSHGSVDLLDSDFDTSPEDDLNTPYYFSRSLMLYKDGASKPFYVNAGRRCVVFASETVDFAYRLFSSPSHQLRDWRSIECAMAAAGVTRASDTACSGGIFLGMSRFVFDDVDVSGEYMYSYLPEVVKDISIHIWISSHAQACIPRTDTAQLVRLRNRQTSLFQTGIFVTTLQSVLCRMEDLSPAAFRKLEWDIRWAWIRLKRILGPYGLFGTDYDFRKLLHNGRLGCLHALAFEFVVICDKWLISQTFFVGADSFGDRILCQRTRVLEWLAKQPIIDPCEHQRTKEHDRFEESSSFYSMIRLRGRRRLFLYN